MTCSGIPAKTTPPPIDKRVYFDVKLMDDSLLAQHVDWKTVYESSDYVESFALSLGVDPAAIISPTPYKIRRQAELYTYMVTAMRKSMFTTGKEADDDSYALKYKMYKQMLAEVEASINSSTYTTGIPAAKRQFPMQVEVLRR